MAPIIQVARTEEEDKINDMKTEELEEADSKLVHHEKRGETISVIRDKVYKWKGKYVSIYESR